MSARYSTDLAPDDEVVPPDQASEQPAAPSKNRALKLLEGPLSSVLVFLGLMGVWQLLANSIASSIILPEPTRVLVALIRGIRRGIYLEHLMWTGMSMILGFFLAMVAGVVIGSIIAYSKWAHRVVYPYVIVFQSFPKIAIAPLLVLWLGYGASSKVVVAALTAFLPILSSVESGLSTVEPERLDLMDSLQATKWQSFRHVRLPSALPQIFSGLHVGLIFAMLGAIVAEFVGSTKGLGVLILNLNYSMDIAGVFSVLVVLALFGVTLHVSIQALRRRFIFWTGEGARDAIDTA